MKDKCGQEIGKRIEAFSSKRLIESIIKNRRNKLRVIEMFFKESEDGKGIVNKDILTI